MQMPRLTRSRREKVIAGVCGGLAQYFEVDPTLVRLIFIVLFFSGGLAVPLYLVLWFVMPKERPDWSAYGANDRTYRAEAGAWHERTGTAGFTASAERGGAFAGTATAARPEAAPGAGPAAGATAAAPEPPPAPEPGPGPSGPTTGPNPFADRYGPSPFAGPPFGRPGGSGTSPYSAPDQPPFGPYPWIEADLAAAKERRRPVIAAALLIGIGALLLAQNLGLFSLFNWGVLWPAALIVLGLALLLGKRNRRARW